MFLGVSDDSLQESASEYPDYSNPDWSDYEYLPDTSCPDVIPPEGTLLHSTGWSLAIICAGSPQARFLYCEDGQWQNVMEIPGTLKPKGNTLKPSYGECNKGRNTASPNIQAGPKSRSNNSYNIMLCQTMQTVFVLLQIYPCQ